MSRSRSLFDERTKRADNTRPRALVDIEAARLRLDHLAGRTRGPSTTGRSAGGAGGKGKSREIVVRVVSKGKHPLAPQVQARYIGRVAQSQEREPDRDPVPLEDQDGREHTGRAQIDAAMARWNLVDAEENRSAVWRRAGPEERAQMDAEWRNAGAEWRKKHPERDPYHRVQSVHLVVSVPDGDPEALRAAVRAAAAQEFGGRRYLFGIHTDHGRGPHAHLIVEAVDRQGRALPMRRGDLDRWRHRFAAQAQTFGLDVVATRRADRPEMRAEISRGTAPLHEHDRTRGKWTPGDTFRKNAPSWYEAHGARYELARAGEAPPKPLPRFLDRFKRPSRPLTAHSEALAATGRQFAHYADPDAALRSYLTMYQEAPRSAQWAYTRHPQAFGVTTGPPPAKPPPGRMAARAARDAAPHLLHQAQADPTPAREAADRTQEERRRTSVRTRGELAMRRLATVAEQIGDQDGARAAVRAAEEIRTGIVTPAPPPRPPAPGRRPAIDIEAGTSTTQENARMSPVQRFTKADADVKRLTAAIKAGNRSEAVLEQHRAARSERTRLVLQIHKSPQLRAEAAAVGAADRIATLHRQHAQALRRGPELTR